MSTVIRGRRQGVSAVGALGLGRVEDGVLRENLDHLVVLRVCPVPRSTRQVGDGDEIGGVRRVDGEVI
eukprot:6407328-Pyramimonas_sp.AAC.1